MCGGSLLVHCNRISCALYSFLCICITRMLSQVTPLNPHAVSPLVDRIGMLRSAAGGGAPAVESTIIAVAAAVATGSTHPLSLAILTRARALGLPTSVAGAETRTTVPGACVCVCASVLVGVCLPARPRSCRATFWCSA